MNKNAYQLLLAVAFAAFLVVSVAAQTFRAKDFYRLNAGNSWNYTAPPAWKGDYVSRMENGNIIAFEGKNFPTILHFDATNAAKILAFVKGKGIYYFGENFADKTSVRFDESLLWFPEKLKIEQQTKLETAFTRTFPDGKTLRGTFKITQKIAALEDVKVTVGEFKKTLKIESETSWDLGDGRRARSINTYSYAKKVGVVRASARFIILNAENKETVNRLIETDLKSYKIQK